MNKLHVGKYKTTRRIDHRQTTDHTEQKHGSMAGGHSSEGQAVWRTCMRPYRYGGQPPSLELQECPSSDQQRRKNQTTKITEKKTPTKKHNNNKKH